MPDLLGTTLILLVACSLAAALTARLKIPTLLGYLLVGVLLGPPVTAWIMPGPALNFLSEPGVALLLFMVGLEFSLGHFWLTRRTVLVAGMLQMAMVAAPLAVLGWLLALVPLKMGLNFLALRATRLSALDACRRSTPGAQASCWGMAASLRCCSWAWSCSST